MDTTLHAHGKLLLSGEYFVLDGALALAVPTRLGQSLSLERVSENALHWLSLDEKGNAWFEGFFELPALQYQQGNDDNTGRQLEEILRQAQALNRFFPEASGGLRVTTRLEFPRDWGLGSSSTLISLIARWAGVDPYVLLFHTMGGSGYDIACATAGKPLLYQKGPAGPQSVSMDYRPAFIDKFYFVHLGRKQNSREGIARYRAVAGDHPEWVEAISRLTRQICGAETLENLQAAVAEHELLISEALQLPRARDLYFPDFPGEIKSLGAWGGDFVWAISQLSRAETQLYFNKKGFSVVIPYDEMVAG